MSEVYPSVQYKWKGEILKEDANSRYYSQLRVKEAATKYTLKLGERVYINSGSTNPFIGEITEFYQCKKSGSKRFKALWFYRQSDLNIEGDSAANLRADDIFFSNHANVNEVEMIVGKCTVLFLSPEQPIPAKKTRNFYLCRYFVNTKVHPYPISTVSKKKIILELERFVMLFSASVLSELKSDAVYWEGLKTYIHENLLRAVSEKVLSLISSNDSHSIEDKELTYFSQDANGDVLRQLVASSIEPLTQTVNSPLIKDSKKHPEEKLSTFLEFQPQENIDPINVIPNTAASAPVTAHSPIPISTNDPINTRIIDNYESGINITSPNEDMKRPKYKLKGLDWSKSDDELILDLYKQTVSLGEDISTAAVTSLPEAEVIFLRRKILAYRQRLSRKMKTKESETTEQKFTNSLLLTTIVASNPINPNQNTESSEEKKQTNLSNSQGSWITESDEDRHTISSAKPEHSPFMKTPNGLILKSKKRKREQLEQLVQKDVILLGSIHTNPHQADSSNGTSSNADGDQSPIDPDEDYFEEDLAEIPALINDLDDVAEHLFVVQQAKNQALSFEIIPPSLLDYYNLLAYEEILRIKLDYLIHLSDNFIHGARGSRNSSTLATSHKSSMFSYSSSNHSTEERINIYGQGNPTVDGHLIVFRGDAQEMILESLVRSDYAVDQALRSLHTYIRPKLCAWSAEEQRTIHTFLNSKDYRNMSKLKSLLSKKSRKDILDYMFKFIKSPRNFEAGYWAPPSSLESMDTNPADQGDQKPVTGSAEVIRVEGDAAKQLAQQTLDVRLKQTEVVAEHLLPEERQNNEEENLKEEKLQAQLDEGLYFNDVKEEEEEEGYESEEEIEIEEANVNLDENEDDLLYWAGNSRVLRNSIKKVVIEKKKEEDRPIRSNLRSLTAKTDYAKAEVAHYKKITRSETLLLKFREMFDDYSAHQFFSTMYLWSLNFLSPSELLIRVIHILQEAYFIYDHIQGKEISLQSLKNHKAALEKYQRSSKDAKYEFYQLFCQMLPSEIQQDIKAIPLFKADF